MKRYCFIVTSTIHSLNTCYSTEERFEQTKDTLYSIRQKVPNSHIILIDNSHVDLPDDYVKYFEANTDKFIRYEHNLASLYYNLTADKSLGELMIMYRALEEVKKLDVIFERIFKLSGRYTLNENFNIDDYDELSRFIVGGVHEWTVNNEDGESKRLSFATSLWSFPFDEIDNIKNILLMNTYEFILKTNHGIVKPWRTDLENAFFNCIPKEILYDKNPIGVTTNWAVNGKVFKY
jgi:hypothetical protein